MKSHYFLLLLDADKNNVWNSSHYTDITEPVVQVDLKTIPPESNPTLFDSCNEFKNTGDTYVENHVKDFTESDFLNKNVFDKELLCQSAPNYFDVGDSGKSIKKKL